MRFLAIGLISVFLAACGTKGPLTQLPRSQPTPPLLNQAGEKLRLMPSSADLVACSPACVAACPTATPAGSLLPPAKPWPEALAGAPASTLRTPAACNAACMSNCPPGYAGRR